MVKALYCVGWMASFIAAVYLIAWAVEEPNDRWWSSISAGVMVALMSILLEQWVKRVTRDDRPAGG